MENIEAIYIINGENQLIFSYESLNERSDNFDYLNISQFFSVIKTFALKIGEKEAKIIELGNSKIFKTLDDDYNIEVILKCNKNLKEKKASINLTKILNLFRECPFFLNGFVLSGKENLMLLFAGEDLASLESIIDERLRSNEDVQSAEFNILISSIKDFILPIKMIERPLNKPPCGIDYKACESYYENRCFGCPATGRYKGLFW